MVCLIKSQYKAELKHYADILGSEEAAYYVLAANNGFTLDKTPQGNPSDLYNFLLEVGGSEEKAILNKAVAYTPKFLEENGNWLESGGQEPSAYTLNGGERFTDGSSLSEVLSDSGRYVEMCNSLEDANILDHELIISAAIGEARDSFVDKYLTNWLESHKDPDLFEKTTERMSAEQTWTLNKIDELMGKTREVLGKRLKLKSKIVDGKIVFYTESDNEQERLRVEFVNSLTHGDYLSVDGSIKQGVFFDKHHVDGLYNLILISLEDGDPTAVIHELSHDYIRRFWNSEPVQRALRVTDAENVGRLTSREIEELLVDDITKKVMSRSTNKFWNGFRKVMRMITGGLLFKEKLEIRDLLTSYFILNKDLSYQQAELLTYEMYNGPMYKAKHNVSEEDVFRGIVTGLKRKLKALLATDASTADILRTKLNIYRMSLRNPGVSADVESTVEDFLNLAIEECAEAERLLSNVVANGIDSLDIKQFMDLRSNVVQYYQAVLNNHIMPLVDNKTAPYVLPGTLLYDQYSLMATMVSRLASLYDNILSRYVDKYIDDFVLQTVDVGDRAKISENMKHWVRNEIRDGRLMAGELFFGGTTSSRSPIVRMVEYMISDCNTKVRIDTNSLGHKLKALYDKCKPAVSFSDFMKTFVEKGSNGKPTGFFIRDINYGKFYDDRDAFIAQLDKKHNVVITLDEDGNEVRNWPSDQVWKDYQDELDDWYGKHAHRKFKPEYYKDRRKYLSRDTIEELDAIQDRINVILNKCTDPVTKIPYTFELSTEDRQELRKLNRDKELLASPYIITLDIHGNIVNIQEKSGDAKRMSDELIEWKKMRASNLKYAADLAKFKLVEQYVLNKYGTGSIEMAKFKEDYLVKEINNKLWEDLAKSHYSPAIQRLIDELKAKRKSILNVCYDGHRGYILPDLSKLNDKAFEELKKIDMTLDAITRDPSKVKTPFGLDFQDIFFFRPVPHAPSNTTYLEYLENKAVSLTIHNPNAIALFYQKYYYVNQKGEHKPLSVFFYISPLRSNQALSSGEVVSTIVDTPTGAFLDVTDTSLYVDDEWNPNDKISILPSRDVYDNSEEFNRVMSDPNKKAFYYALIEAMDNAYKKLPHYHENAKYLMPQIANKELGRIAGGWRDIYGALKGIGGIDDDIELNMSQTLRPDGTPVNLIPIRWNRRRKDFNISTDILYTVVAFSKMASEYELKIKVMPTIEAIIQESRNNPIAHDQLSQQTKRLEDYTDMHLYGNYKKPLLKDKFGDSAGDMERRLSQGFAGVLGIAHMKLMSHNFRAIVKNLLDSAFTAIAEIGGGKYFTFKDFMYGLHYAFKDIIKAFGSINNANTKSKLAAAMQFNGAAESVDELFQHNNNSWITRFFKKFFCMGEYTLVDYLIKGGVTAMIYHHHRLIVNPKTGKREFLTQDQARYAYLSAGKTAEDGAKAWSKANITLWDAYDIDDNGDFILKRFKDAIRPIDSNGNVSTKVETRVAGTIRERGSVINGVLDTANKGNLAATYLGAAFMQMRGWMVSHAFDYFKDGEDFAEFIEAYKSNLNLNAKLKNSNQLVKETEDFAYRGQYNFETGTVERGTLRGILKAIGRVLAAVTTLNRHMSVKKPTRNERYLVRRLTWSMLGLALSILATVWTGKKLEDDPDDELTNFMYSVAVATTSERATTIPGVQLLTTLDVIRTPFIGYTLIQDAPSVFNLIMDGYEAATYDFYNSSTYPEYNQTINRGSYKGLENWQRDALKASAELYPYININNIVKNKRKESNRSSANYYRSIFPTGALTYKPQINQTSQDQHWTGKIWDWTTSINEK